MSTPITESEMNNILSNRGRENFELLQETKKKTFEFYVNVKNKDAFLQWIKVLSGVEFRVSMNLDDIWIKEYDKAMFRFRAKVSGKEKNLKMWNDNLSCVAEFLRGDYDITYLKHTAEQKN